MRLAGYQLTVVLCHMFLNSPEASVGLFTWWLQDSKYRKEEGKPQCLHAFHLYRVIFSNVLFAQASHVAKPSFEEWRNRVCLFVGVPVQSQCQRTYWDRKNLWSLLQSTHSLPSDYQLFTFLSHAKYSHSRPQKSHPNFDIKFDVWDLGICIRST